jgi:hypothetical protein
MKLELLKRQEEAILAEREELKKMVCIHWLRVLRKKIGIF